MPHLSPDEEESVLFAMSSLAWAEGPARGPAGLIVPSSVSVGTRLPLGERLHLDLRGGCAVWWSKARTDVAYAPTDSSITTKWLGLAPTATVAPRWRLGGAGAVAGWWVVEGSGGPSFSWLRTDSDEAPLGSRTVQARLATGPGFEVDVSKRWTMGLDLGLGLARYEVGESEGITAGYRTDKRDTRLDLGLPTDVSWRILLARYRDPR